MKRYISLLLAFTFIVTAFSFTGCGEKGAVTVLDSDGNVIAVPETFDFSREDIEVPGYSSYVEIVLAEAASVLRLLYDYSDDEAEKALLKDGYTIKTSFVPEIYSAINSMNNDFGSDAVAVGCSVTDYDGNLLAVFSSDEVNYAASLQSPHSSFKPLSVYAPAMEEGIIDWSSMYVDMPYMTVDNGSGKLEEWPSNASGTYSGERVGIYEGVKHSLNTMAVHVLHDYGVTKSIQFLTESFGMDFSYEQSRMAVKGEDEIIGNIALGSLYNGVTTVDMAGYYQIFGNLGKYERPHCILEICDAEGKAIYKYESQKKQIISEDTAYIMNRLLKGVVETDGTGESAYCEGIEVAGKTGTGTYGEGNWFVGVTPEYSIAVWHSAATTGNIASSMFSRIVSYMPEANETRFKPSGTVRKTVLCAESGLLFSAGCMRMQVGYFVEGNEPDKCTEH